MFFPVLKKLRESNPRLTRTIEALDQYLARLDGPSRMHITASGVAEELGAPRDQVLGLLMASANQGLLKLKFRLICPITNGGLRDFENLSDIPKRVECDVCGERNML